MPKYCFTSGFKAAKKNHLVQLHKNRRLHFGWDYIHIPEEMWAKTIFIDEKTFSTHKDGRIGVWRPKNTR